MGTYNISTQDKVAIDVDMLKRLCDKDQVARDLIDEVCKPKHGGDHKSEDYAIKTYNISLDKVAKDGGNSKDAGLRRPNERNEARG